MTDMPDDPVISAIRGVIHASRKLELACRAVTRPQVVHELAAQTKPATPIRSQGILRGSF